MFLLSWLLSTIGAERAKATTLPLLTVVGDKNPGIDYNDWSLKAISEARTKLIAANIPFYPTMGRAATAAKKLVDYYRERK